MVSRERTEADRTLAYARQLRQGRDTAEQLMKTALARADEPLLFVGVGGTGSGIVARVKRRWELVPSERRAGRVQFFCVDTASLDDNVQDPVVREQLDPVTEFESLCPPGADLAAWYDQLREGRPDEFEKEVGWYDERQRPYGEQLGPAGAGAFRQFGRLAFAYGSGRVLAKLDASAQAILAPARGGELVTIRRPSVWVVSGMSGGTGSGIFLDMVRAVHHVFDGSSPRVSAVLVMPDIYKESALVSRSAQMRMRPNAYAFLKELDWTVAKNRTPKDYREYKLELERFPEGTTPNPQELVLPIYLLDKDLPKANIAVRDIDDVKELAADGLFALTMGMSERDRRANIDGWITEETEGQRSRVYATYGVSRALVPIYSIVRYLGLALFARAVAQGLLYHSTEVATGAVDEDAAAEELVDRLNAICDGAFNEREDGPSLPRLNLEDLKAQGATRAVNEYTGRLDRLVDAYQAELKKDGAQVIDRAVAAARQTIDDYLTDRAAGVALTTAILERAQTALREQLRDLSSTTTKRRSDGGAAQARLTKHSSGILRALLGGVGFDQAERTTALAGDAGLQARMDAQERISNFVLRERQAFYARVADHTAFAGLSDDASLLETSLASSRRAQTRLDVARREAVRETDHFRINRQVDGEISVATWLFPPELRATDLEGRGADDFMASLLDRMGANEPDAMRVLTRSALERARQNAPGFALHLIADGSKDRRFDYLDVLRGGYMQAAEEQLERVAPGIARGILACAAEAGVTLADICSRLDTYGQPPLRLTPVAKKNYEDGSNAESLITWLGPPGTRAQFIDLGHDGAAWSEGPSNYEVARVFTHYGLALEDVHGLSDFRRAYTQFVRDYCSKTAKTVRTVHVARGLAERLDDPLVALDPERVEDAYERFFAGLLLGKLFVANAAIAAHVAALKELVSTPATFPPRLMLPAPIQRETDGHYHLADYRIAASARGDRVYLASEDSVDLGRTVKEAVETLMDGAEGRAPAIEALAEQVLSAGGPFAPDANAAIRLLTTFLGVMQSEMEKAEDDSERSAFGRLCQEIQEEIDEREQELANSVFRVED